jgi:hypothetical protein
VIGASAQIIPGTGGLILRSKGGTLLDGTKPPQGSTDWQVHISPRLPILEALATSWRVICLLAMTARLMTWRRSHAAGLFLARAGAKRHIVVDQFEELFTLCRDELNGSLH